jgi:MFS family permease
VPTARLTIVCGVTALWAVSFGIGAQATTHWLKLRQASDSLIGFVHAFYYLGVAATALIVPSMTRRLGLGTTSLGLLVSAFTLLLFPFTGGAGGWLLMRLLNGAGCALSLIPLETYLSRQSAPERRTETFGYYAVALTLAGAAGIALGLDGFNSDGLLIHVLGSPRNAFLLGAVFPFVGSMIAHHALAREEWDTSATSIAFSLSWKQHFLSFGTAWGQGFLEGGMLAFLSLYLVSHGLSTSAAGILMGVTMIGVIAFQVPVAWIADRCGRTPTLLACYAVTIVGLAVVPFCETHAWLGFWLLLFGACSGAMYPLGLSLLDANLPASRLARAYAWYLAMECVGSQMGAVLMGRARDLWGGGAMFAVAATALVGIVVAAAGIRVFAKKAQTSDANPVRRAA